MNIGLQTKGLRSEEIVVQHFEKLGFRTLKRRQKVVGVEIDLIFHRNNEFHFVEVKTWKEGMPLIHQKQLRRLKRAAETQSLRHRSSVRLHLVAVESQAVLHIHWDMGDEV